MATVPVVANAFFEVRGTFHNGRMHRTQAWLCWTEEPALERFSCWLDRYTGASSDAINKSSPESVGRNDSGYFLARGLDATKPVNVARLAKARELAGGHAAFKAAWVALAQKQIAEAIRAAEVKQASECRAAIAADAVTILEALDLLLANPNDAGYRQDAATVLAIHATNLAVLRTFHSGEDREADALLARGL